jgi:hypothetical protein
MMKGETPVSPFVLRRRADYLLSLKSDSFNLSSISP